MTCGLVVAVFLPVGLNTTKNDFLCLINFEATHLLLCL